MRIYRVCVTLVISGWMLGANLAPASDLPLPPVLDDAATLVCGLTDIPCLPDLSTVLESSVIIPWPEDTIPIPPIDQIEGSYPQECYGAPLMLYGNAWDPAQYSYSNGVYRTTTKLEGATGYRFGTTGRNPCGPWIRAERIWVRGSTSPIDNGVPLAILRGVSYQSCVVGEAVTAPVQSTAGYPAPPDGAITFHGIGDNDTATRATYRRGIVTNWVEDVTERIWPAYCPEPPPTVQFSSAAQSVSEAQPAAAVVVQLSKASSSIVTVPYALGGSATNGADYTVSPSSPLTIPAGQTSATLTINIVSDTLVESDETVVFTLGSPTNATVGATASHTLTIVSAATACPDTRLFTYVCEGWSGSHPSGSSIVIPASRTIGNRYYSGEIYATCTNGSWSVNQSQSYCEE